MLTLLLRCDKVNNHSILAKRELRVPFERVLINEYSLADTLYRTV